jgi:hypothetical protein
LSTHLHTAVIALATCALCRAETNAELKEQVRRTEIGFAKTMADRNPAAFATFLAGEAVFFSGSGAQRGAKQVADGWKRFFEGPAAPFSWEPDQVGETHRYL